MPTQLDLDLETRATIGAGGPPAGQVSAPARLWGQRETHPILNVDPSRIHRALVDAYAGRPAVLQDLFDDLRDRDDRIDTVCRTRILAITGRSWVVKPPEWLAADDSRYKDAEDLAQRIAEVLGTIRAGARIGGGGWTTVVGNVADGVLRGYSVNELEWGVDRRGWKVPKRIHYRHPNRFVMTRDLELAKRDPGDPYEGTPLRDLGRDKFVVHAPTAGRSGYPMRRGVMLSMLYPAIVKRYALRYWLKGAERWGQPVPVATFNDDNGGAPNEQARADVLKFMRNLDLNSYAAVWGGWEVKAFDAGSGMSADVYEKLLETSNVAITTIGLGQNLTTEVQGGSFAAAKSHQVVRDDILDADLAELDDTITQQIIEPICRYNAPGIPVPVYSTVVDRKAEPTIMDVQLGICSKDERREFLGHEPLPDSKGAEAIALTGPATPDESPPVGGGGDVLPFPAPPRARRQ